MRGVSILSKMCTPTPVVLFCGGSFNPVTNLHLRLFEVARDHLQNTGQFVVKEGIISPVSDSYEKAGLASATHRIEMIRLALQSSDWISVSTWEAHKNEWTRTTLALAHHKQMVNNHHQSLQEHKQANDQASVEPHSPVRLMLVCGADLLESFAVPKLWDDRDIETIVKDFGIVCISRIDSNSAKFVYEHDTLYRYRHNIHLVSDPISNEVSATKVRRAIRRNESVKYLLQDPVIDYIRQHKLYGYGETSDSKE